MGRPITHTLVGSLRAVPDFAALDDEVLLHVVGASANLIWRAGSVIFSPGDTAEALYVVLTGRVRITEADDTVAELGPLEYFGEQALLLHTDHSRHAEAIEDSELMVIPRARFEDLLDAQPALAKQFRHALEARIREYGGSG